MGTVRLVTCNCKTDQRSTQALDEPTLRTASIAGRPADKGPYLADSLRIRQFRALSMEHARPFTTRPGSAAGGASR
jgi:hypothetical protein